MTINIEFDFKNGIVDVHKKGMGIININDFFQSLKEDIDKDNGAAFSFDNRQICIYNYGDTICYDYSCKDDDRDKLNTYLNKLNDYYYQNLIIKLKILERECTSNNAVKCKIELINKAYYSEIGFYDLTIPTDDLPAKVKLSKKDLENVEIKKMIDKIIYKHDHNEKFVFYDSFDMKSNNNTALSNVLASKCSFEDITKLIDSRDIQNLDILINYIKKRKPLLLAKLLTKNIYNDPYYLIKLMFMTPVVAGLWGTIIIMLCLSGASSLAISIVNMIFGMGGGFLIAYKPCLFLHRINKNLTFWVNSIEKKYNLNSCQKDYGLKEKSLKTVGEERCTKKIESIDPFLRNLFDTIAKMKEYPEIDWSYEAEAIEDLAKKYVETKQKSALPCFELLNKYSNFLEISNNIDELIKEKIKLKYTNELETLDAISMELDCLKNVTMNTGCVRKLDLKKVKDF